MQIASAPVLAYFDKEAHTQIISDASPVRLGAMLVQGISGEYRAVCYASRTLSPVERRYSQTEKKALALVWACERFHLYVYGVPKFDLETDHETLKSYLFKKVQTVSTDRALGSASSTVQVSSLLRSLQKEYSRCLVETVKD